MCRRQGIERDASAIDNAQERRSFISLKHVGHCPIAKWCTCSDRGTRAPAIAATRHYLEKASICSALINTTNNYQAIVAVINGDDRLRNSRNSKTRVG